MRAAVLLRFAMVLSAALALPTFAAGSDMKALRVCADPNNLPLSDRKGEGYENRIAQLIGKDLGLPVEYTWAPQRMGFIRNTLRAPDGNGGYKCDVIIGVPADYELTATTRPYLHSSWVMVFPDRPELASVKNAEDILALPAELLRRLRFGAFTQTQAFDWLFKHNFFEQTLTYPALSPDPDEYPGQIIQDDLTDGKIDVALVWGPIGGYFAKRSARPLRMVPFTSTPEYRFDYLLAFGVRHPDKQWRDTLDGVIARHQAEIDRILEDYGVPRLELPSPPAGARP